MLHELSFNYRECSALSGLALWALLWATAGTVVRSVSARWRVRADWDTGRTAAADGEEMRSRQVAGCVASTGLLWCCGEVERWTLYSLLCQDRLALLDASSFLKYNRQITPSGWMLGWLECPPFILIAHHRPGLPLASQQIW